MNDSRGQFLRLCALCACALAAPSPLAAHPMGNFSINHYALIMPGAQSVEVLYVLDLAELPTLQLLQKWDVTKDSPRAVLEAKARAEAEEWLRNLTFSESGLRVTAKLDRTDIAIADGAGGLPVLRVNSHVKILWHGQPGKPTTFEYEDRNFAERAGWKEVVIEARAGGSVANAVPAGQDRTRALTAYPQDPTVAPPQDTIARFDWTREAPVVSELSRPVPPVLTAPPPLPQTPAAQLPQSNPPIATGATPAEAQSLGSVKRGDFLSRTLKNSKGSLSFELALVLLAAAFGVGALHAVEPGHGKTMVAAYLVGSKGTFRQAIFLGGMVTFTHTISVFALGLATLFLAQYVLPDTLIRVTSVISGVSIIWIGGLLLYRRARKLWSTPAVAGHTHEHHHSHEPHSHEPHTHSEHSHSHHDHAHEHVPAHSHTHASGHRHAGHSHAGHSHSHPHHEHHHHDAEHSHAQVHSHTHEAEHAHHHHAHGHSHGLTHTHDGHTHSHVPEGEVTLGNLIALGISGGLVPCPAALVLLLSCISLGRPGLGLLLLISFSVGLALVLMLIGVMVLVVKNTVPKSRKPSHLAAWARFAPVVSAALIFAIGIYMTGVAVGAFPIVRMIG